MKTLIINTAVRRIVYIVIALLLAFLSDKVFAGYVYNGVTPALTGNDSATMCTTLASHLTSVNTQGVVFTSKGVSGTNLQTCKIGRVQNGNTIPDLNYQFTYTAPPVCVAPQINDPITEACVDPEPENTCMDAVGGKIDNLSTPTNSATICLDGCELKRTNTICVELADNSVSCLSDGLVTGAQCVANNNIAFDIPLTPEAECMSKNMTYGTVQGEVKCVPIGTAGAAPTTQSNEKVTTVTNAEGTTTTTKEITQNPDGTTTTTTTINSPSGTETQTQTEQSEDYCAKNPNDKACKAPEEGSDEFGNPDGNNSANNNFYTSKYPTGIDGIWSTAKTNMLNSSLGTAIGDLTPNFGDSGTAPSWAMNMNIGTSMNLGTHNLDFDLWNALSVIFIVTSLFAARRIIFGG